MTRRGVLVAAVGAALAPLIGRGEAPEATAPSCALGEWVVVDIGAFIEASFDGMLGVREIEFREANGEFRFTFGEDGAIRIEARDYVVTVVAKVRFVGDVETAVTFDGVIAGRYVLDGERLMLSGTDNRDFSIRARTPFGSFDAGSDDFFGDGESRLACGDGGLVLFPGTGDVPPILLVRPDPATPAAGS